MGVTRGRSTEPTLRSTIARGRDDSRDTERIVRRVSGARPDRRRLRAIARCEIRAREAGKRLVLPVGFIFTRTP